MSVNNIVEIDDRLRILGTAHVSSESVELVRNQIEEWEPDLIAVELCPSRMAALTEPESLDSDCLLYTSPSPRDATLSRMPSSA